MAALTQKIFAQGIGLLAARWKEIPPAQAAIVAEWLKGNGCTAEEFIAGVKRAIAEEDFAPSAKKILELGRPDVPAESLAGEAWAAVLALRKYVVPYGSRLSLDEVGEHVGDAARRAVVAIGGSSRLINLTDEALPFVFKDFARHFAAFAREEQSRATAERFLGTGSSPRQLHRGRAWPTPIGEIANAQKMLRTVPDVTQDTHDQGGQ